MQQISAVGVVSIGAMFVIISGGIDFTAGYGLAMIGMAAGHVPLDRFFKEASLR